MCEAYDVKGACMLGRKVPSKTVSALRVGISELHLRQLNSNPVCCNPINPMCA